VTREEFEVVAAMTKYGGGFIKALAECFRRADHGNWRKLRATFSGYWAEYAEMARRDRHEGGTDG
jgi:hypothetical protein